MGKQDQIETTFLIWLTFVAFLGGAIYGYNVSLSPALPLISNDSSIVSSQSEATTDQTLLSASTTVSDMLSMLLFTQGLQSCQHILCSPKTTKSGFNELKGGFVNQNSLRRQRYQFFSHSFFLALISSLTSAIGAFFAALMTQDLTSLIIARVLVGIGNGLSILSLPILISERLESHSLNNYKGVFIGIYQVGIVVANAFSYGIGRLTRRWRMILLIGGFPGILLFLFLFLSCFLLNGGWRKKSIADNGNESVKDRLLLLENSNSVYNTKIEDECSLERDVEKKRSMPSYSMLVVLACILGFCNNTSDALVFYGSNLLGHYMSACNTSSPSSTKNITNDHFESTFAQENLLRGVKDAQNNHTTISTLCYEQTMDVGILIAGFSLLPLIAVLIFLKFYTHRRTLYLSMLAIIALSYVTLGVLGTTHGTGVGVTLYILIASAYQLGPGTLFLVILPEMFAVSEGSLKIPPKDNNVDTDFSERKSYDNQKEEKAKWRLRGVACGTACMSLTSIVCNGSLLFEIDAIGLRLTLLSYGIVYLLCFGFLYIYLPETGLQRQSGEEDENR
eukprot:g2538.t1